MSNRPISRWLRQYIGAGRPYASPRALSLAAGLSQSTVPNILQTGSADPESLGALADLLGESRIEVFTRAGWLRVVDRRPGASQEEARVLELYYRLPTGPGSDARQVWLEQGEAILRLLGLSDQ